MVKHLLFFILVFFSCVSIRSATYYWVHNDVNTNLSQYSKDQVNATNTGAGTVYWKHFSFVSGSSAIANLVPAGTPITSNDNIIINNLSVPSRTVLANYVILIDNTGGGLLCQDFDASGWTPTLTELQRLRIQIVTNIDCYRHFRLSPSNKFLYLNGTTLNFPNSSPTTIDSIHFYGTRQANGNTFRYTSLNMINIKTNGKVYFCDTLDNYGPITILANDNIGSAHETHFIEPIWRHNNYIFVLAGNLHIHKNSNYIGAIYIGRDFAGANSTGPVTANARFYAHTAGYYSSPGVWNAGLWADPSYTAQSANVHTYIDIIQPYRGIVDASNSRINDTRFYCAYGPRGTGVAGNGGINYFSNINTYMRMPGRYDTYVSPNNNIGFKFRGTYVLDQNSVVDGVTYLSYVAPRFANDTIVDTLLVKNNVSTFGLGSPNKLFITTTGYAKFYPGFRYIIGNDYIGSTAAYINNDGKFVMGDSKGCDSVATKVNRMFLQLTATGSQTVLNTQIENSKITGTAIQRTINGSNTDMGGNNGWLYSLVAGQQTMYGVVPATASYAYGTAPYNAIPFTAKTPRTLIWDNTISGATYWSEKKWADVAISSTVFNQCPPTFIDSVIVKQGSTLKIDQRSTQCKSFVALAGLPITLSQKVTTAQDSISTLEIFGSFILNQKINNMLNRNIVFRAWQTYPQIKTMGTNFWRGLNFWAINTGTNNPIGQTNPGSWTLMDSLCAYNQNIIFTARPNSAPGCKKVNFDKETLPISDASNNFSTNPINNPFGDNFMVVFTGGNFYTNNKNIHTYSMKVSPFLGENMKLYLGSSTINLYDGAEYLNLSTTSNIQYGLAWYSVDRAQKATVFAGTSHIKIHSKAFINAAAYYATNNITTSTFNNKGQNYYDVSFLQNDTTNATYNYLGNIYTTGAGVTRAGVYQSLNCNYHNLTFWSADPTYPQFSSFRDTISKLTYKYNTGSLNTGAFVTFTVGNSYVVPPLITQTNSSIDSLIFETKKNSISGPGLSPGNLNLRKYLYFSPGSTNSFYAGSRHKIYNNASVVFTKKPWEDKSPALPPDNPAYVAPSAYTPFVWAPWGAKVKSQATCDEPTILKYGGFDNAGNSVAYPTPYYYSGAAPRDTFDIKNWIVVQDSLTQPQTVDPSISLSGSSANWITGTVTPRTLVFRDGGLISASWFDKTKWAKIISYSPYTVGPVGECIPQCGDSVIYDGTSFSAPTNSCSIGSANSAYCGTMAWRTGVTGVLEGSSNSILTICNSLYFNATMTNSYLGQTVFTAIDSNKVEYIQSGNKFFQNQVLFDARSPSKYKTAWKLLDSLSTLPIANSISPAVKINGGNFDTRGKNMNLTGGIDLVSTRQRGANFHNSRIIATGGRAGYVNSGNQYAFYIEGDYTKLRLKADSSNIYVSSTYSAAPTSTSYAGHFITWNANGSSQFYTTAPRGFKFNSVTVTSMSSITNSNFQQMYLRSDTINSLTIVGRTNWSYFYKGYIKTLSVQTPTSSPASTTIGNLNGTGTALVNSMRFKGRADTVRINHRYAVAGSFYWDTLYVKDEITLAPGSALNFAKGGLTWFKNTCAVNIVGTAALPVSLSTNASIGISYNYVSGNRVQNEHYFRQDSGKVCTDFTQIYNVWAIGNGNGNNSCTGGSAYGCSLDPVATATAYGTWMAPILSPTVGVRTLSDTTFFSSATPAAPTSGRAQFLAGGNADYGYPNPITSHNSAGWDGAAYPFAPKIDLKTNNATICEGDSVRVRFELQGAAPYFGFNYFANTNTPTFPVGSNTLVNVPGNIIPSSVGPAYSTTVGLLPGDSIAIKNPTMSTSTFGGSTNPYIYSFWAKPTQTIRYTSGTIAVDRCFNNVSSIGTGTCVITVNPAPKNIIATATPSSICNSVPVIFTTTATFGNSYFTYSSPTSTPGTAMTSYTTAGPVYNGSTTVSTFTTGLTSTTYTTYIGAVSALGCKSLTRAAVPVIVNPTATVQLTALNFNPICFGQSAVISATSNAATSVLLYTVGIGGVSQGTFTGNNYTVSPPVGNYTYYLQANASTGCNAAGIRPSITLTVNAIPALTVTASSATICNGNTSTLTAGGGATYNWLNPVSTTTSVAVSPTTTTVYSVTATSSLNCTSPPQQITINVNTTPTVAITSVSSPTICSGNTTTITPGGAGSYTLLNTGATTTTNFSVNPNSNTTYSIIGTSPFNCPASNTVQTLITVNTSPTLAISSVSSPTICSGNTTTITPSGANSYTLVNTGATSSTDFSVAPGANTTYSIIGLSSANCPGTNTVQTLITVNASPTLAITSVSNPTICTGNSTTITPGGATTYTLVNTGAISTANFSVNPIANTTYSIIGLSSANCPGTNTVQTLITVNTTPTISISSVSNSTICSGNTTTITPAGANNYTLVNTGATSTTNFSVTPGANTTYSIIGSSAANCIANNTVQALINVNASPTLAITSVSSPTICSGNTTTITPGGASNYTLINTGATSTTNFSVNPNSNATYSIIGLSSANCPGTNTVQATITVNASPTLAITSVSSPTICSGSSTTITPSGANSYTLLNSGATSTTDFSVNPNTSTTYSIIGLSSTNCVGTNTIQTLITVNTTPTLAIASISSPTICSGNITTITPGGANSYTLINTSATSTTNFSVSPVANTTYSIIGESAANCVANNTVQTLITVNTTPTLNVTTTSATICSGQATTLTASGANTYTWTNPVSTNSIITVTPSVSTIYTINASSSANCPAMLQQITINVNATPQITVTPSAVLCYGDNTGFVVINNPTGGTISGSAITSLLQGNYSYTVTDPSTGCNSSQAVTITQPTASLSILAAVTNSNGSCSVPNGATSATVTGGTPGYTVYWSNNTTGLTATNLTTGVYTYSTTDANGCTTAIGTLTVPGVTGITAAVVTQNSVNCFGNTTGAVSYTTAGFGPFNYTLSSGTTTLNNATGTFSNLASGNYSLHVIGAGGCIDNQFITVSQPVNALTVSTPTINNVLCFGGTGSASVVATGGSPSYTYTWQSNVSSTNTASYAAGIYTLNVSDTHGCNVVNSFTITQPAAALNAVSTTSANTSCNSPNGNAMVVVSGGSPNYSYQWQGNTSTANSASGYGTGVFTVSVTDINNCTTSSQFTISGVPAPAISNLSVTNVLCNSANTGGANIAGMGGTPAYTYSWSNGATTQTISGLQAGVYSATITDAGNCKTSQTFTVTEPAALVASTQSLVNPCPGTTNGSLSIEVTGGAPNYTVTWAPNSVVTTGSVSSLSNLQIGTYNAMITDSNGCARLYPVVLTVSQSNECSVIIPEIFSPNGDGKNDVWEVRGLGNYPDNFVKIYNRWGDEVYSAAPYKSDWNGTNHGAKSILGEGQLPAGTYYFVFNLGDGSPALTGYVQITR